MLSPLDLVHLSDSYTICWPIFFRASQYQAPFRVCINIFQITLTNTFSKFQQQAHKYSSVFKFLSDVILSTSTAFLVFFPLLNPNWSSTSTSSIFLSILLKYIRYYLCCFCVEAWIEFCDFQYKALLQKIIFNYSNFAANWNSRTYILAVDYDRYFIGKDCPDGSFGGKCIFCERIVPKYTVRRHIF